VEVHGYCQCRNPSCETLVEHIVAGATGGFCAGCAIDHANEGLCEVKLAVDHGFVTVSTARQAQTARNRRQHLRRKGDPRVKARKHASEKARTAAFKRLAAAAPELFALIYADERRKRGLTPITTAQALRTGRLDPAWATLDAVAFYRALASQECTHDEPDLPTPNLPPAPEAQ
jgi:hypothetical protein